MSDEGNDVRATPQRFDLFRVAQTRVQPRIDIVPAECAALGRDGFQHRLRVRRKVVREFDFGRGDVSECTQFLDSVVDDVIEPDGLTRTALPTPFGGEF